MDSMVFELELFCAAPAWHVQSIYCKATAKPAAPSALILQDVTTWLQVHESKGLWVQSGSAARGRPPPPVHIRNTLYVNTL